MWNVIRSENEILMNNKNHILISRLLYIISLICLFTVITFISNYVIIFTIDRNILNNIYFDGKIFKYIFFKFLVSQMFFLVNIMYMFYFSLNIFIPVVYLINLIKLRNLFLNILDTNFIYFKAERDSMINSNLSPRNPMDCLDMIEKRSEKN